MRDETASVSTTIAPITRKIEVVCFKVVNDVQLEYYRRRCAS
jgi:hypothetical protein